MHALTLSLIVCSATAFSPQVALRAQHLSLRAQHSRRAHTVLVERSSLSPVPIQTKAKSLLIPAIGYAGVAGVALGAQQLVENYMGGYDLTTYMGVPLPIAAIVIPALVLLGEFALLGGGERVAKMMGGEPADAGLKNLCSRVAVRAGLPPPAHVYEIPTSELNAFAAGFGRGDATVAVTSGIRRALSTRELEAVIAHEIGHIRHKDMSTNMHAAVAIAGLGGLYELGNMLLRSDAGDKDDDGEGGAASLGLALMVGGIATRVLAHLLQLSISRGAEYEADKVAAELCGADAMISALSKIDRGSATAPRDQLAARGSTFAHAYISNGRLQEEQADGLKGAWQKFMRIWSTHPSTDDRIEALRNAKAPKRE
jgi:heat shock protein HtpX